MQTDDTAAPGPWLGVEGAAPPEVSAPAAARQAAEAGRPNTLSNPRLKAKV
jgi:hypothetical protein